MAAPLAIEARPGDMLSPSSLSKYLGCAFAWFARYVLKVPDPPSGSLTQGKAVHAAIGENFRHKVETKRDLDAAAVKALYNDAWYKMVRGDWTTPWGKPELPTEFRDDEMPEDMRREGEALALLYLDQYCPGIEPQAVEMKVEGLISGVHVKGFIDVLDVDGRIIDVKTAAKTPSEIRSDYRMQVACYYRLGGGQVSGAARIDTLVKTKVPKIARLECTINAADARAVDTLYPLAQQSIRAGHFLPHRGSFLCNRKYCAAWRVCEQEFGGEVGK
jgi:RecB family exonuclease